MRVRVPVHSVQAAAAMAMAALMIVPMEPPTVVGAVASVLAATGSVIAAMEAAAVADASLCEAPVPVWELQ